MAFVYCHPGWGWGRWKLRCSGGDLHGVGCNSGCMYLRCHHHRPVQIARSVGKYTGSSWVRFRLEPAGVALLCWSLLLSGWLPAPSLTSALVLLWFGARLPNWRTLWLYNVTTWAFFVAACASPALALTFMSEQQQVWGFSGLGVATICAAWLQLVRQRIKQQYSGMDEQYEPVSQVVPRLRSTGQSNPEAECERRVQDAEHLQTVAVLAGGVAHDFNNLLTVIIGHAEALHEDPELDEVARICMGEILAAGESASKLTQQLLTMTRRREVCFEVFDFNTVLDGLRSVLRRTICEDIQISIRTNAAPCYVYADVSQMQYVVMHLVIAARDSLPGGGRIEATTHTVELGVERASAEGLRAGRYVILAVTCEGPAGMAALQPVSSDDVQTVVQQSGGEVRSVRAHPEWVTNLVYLPYATSSDAPSGDDWLEAGGPESRFVAG